MFIFGLCTVLGLFIYNMVFKPELEINKWVYSLIAIFLLLHVIWFNFFPIGYNTEYILDVGSNSDTSGKLYILEAKGVGPRTCIEGSCFREINGSSEIGFKKEYVFENYLLELEYNSTGKIYVNNKLFYDPKWNNYNLVGKVNGYNIYADKKLNLSNINDNSFLNKNLEVYSNFDIENILTSNNFEKEYYGNFEKYEDVNFEKHNTNTSFRGNPTFLGYFDKNLEFEFTKQDLNWYNGTEDLNVSIYDYSNNYITSFKVVDDGINDSSKKTNPQKINKSINLPNKGLYYLKWFLFWLYLF